MFHIFLALIFLTKSFVLQVLRQRDNDDILCFWISITI